MEFPKTHRYVCGVQQCVWEISAGKSQGVLSKDITFSIRSLLPLPVGPCKKSDVVSPLTFNVPHVTTILWPNSLSYSHFSNLAQFLAFFGFFGKILAVPRLPLLRFETSKPPYNLSSCQSLPF